MMKVKGVMGGKARGTIVEMSAQDKVAPAVKMAAAAHEDWGDFVVSVADIKTSAVDFQSNGELLKKKFANNQYTAEGSGTFYFRKKANDTLLAPRTLQFKIRFCDCTDDMGLPELKITSFDVQ